MAGPIECIFIKTVTRMPKKTPFWETEYLLRIVSWNADGDNSGRGVQRP